MHDNNMTEEQRVLCEENLAKLQQCSPTDSIMTKFLADNREQMEGQMDELIQNMPFAMTYYNEEARSPFLFRRIQSPATVKSIYIQDSLITGHNSPEKLEDSLSSDMRTLEEARKQALQKPVIPTADLLQYSCSGGFRAG
jgi:hypothetical protein